MVQLQELGIMASRTWTDEELRTAVVSNVTISGVLRTLGISTSPGNFRSFHCHSQRLSLDTTHFKGRSHGGGSAPVSVDEFFTKDSYRASSSVRRRALKEDLLENKCSGCGMGPEWQGLPITLQLDHINGNPSDNRIENLRILCPNCHAQTETFKGKSGRYTTPPKVCETCGVTIQRRSTRCPGCASRNRPSKIIWPVATDLAMEVTRTSYRAVGTRLGVSDSAVKKHLLRTLGHAPRKHKPRTA